MALALTRRPGESITLSTDNGDITVEVSEVNGHQVRLAITADKSVNIARNNTKWQSAKLAPTPPL